MVHRIPDQILIKANAGMQEKTSRRLIVDISDADLTKALNRAARQVRLQR